MNKAKLIFKYGVMNASKTMQLLMTAHAYEEQGKKVALFTSAIDTRYGYGIIQSRVGLRREAIPVNEQTNIFSIVEANPVHLVLVDEAQFLTENHVKQLVGIVDQLNITVMAYGLLKDFRNQFFEGSKALTLYCDEMQEIQTVCSHPECGEQARFVLKIKDGKPVYTGEQIEIGGNELYRSVCRYHYLYPKGVI